jgi:hypothetical protein
MRDAVKYNLFLLYAIVGFIYTIIDWFKHYGDDGMIFWLILRPFVSLIKGVFWIFLIW